MGIVTDIMSALDGAISNSGRALFENTAQSLGPLALIVATLMLVVIGLGMAFGASRIGMREGLGYMLRICLVFMFGLSWQNFGLVYDALANGLQNLGLSMFATVGAALKQPTAVAAMDAFSGESQNVTNEVIRAQSSITRGVISALLFCLLAVFNAAYILVVGFAKVMIAFLVAVAPLAIIATLFTKTQNLFESWLSALVGYSLWPLAAAAVVATMTLALDRISVPDGKGAGLVAMLGFLVLNTVSLFALLQIPTAVSNLSGQINLANLGAAAGSALGLAAGGAGTLAKKTVGQFISGAVRGGHTSQMARVANPRGTDMERAFADAGNRAAGRMANSATRAKSNIASVASWKK